MDHYSRKSLLPLPGIELSDYQTIERMAEDKINDRLAIETTNIIIKKPYDKIQSCFTTIEDWKCVNIACWACGRLFTNPPVFVPSYVKESEKGEVVFGVTGNMCTFNCAARWINVTLADKHEQKWKAHDNLCLLFFMFTGVYTKYIPVAPNKTELMRYGGTLTEEEFTMKMRTPETCNSRVIGSNRFQSQVIPPVNRPSSIIGILQPSESKLYDRSLKDDVLTSEVQSVWNICINSQVKSVITPVEEFKPENVDTKVEENNEVLDDLLNDLLDFM